jgi:hypothetical protein
VNSITARGIVVLEVWFSDLMHVMGNANNVCMGNPIPGYNATQAYADNLDHV